MELKILFLLTTATVILVCTTDAMYIGISCCTQVAKDFNPMQLRHVKQYEIQKQDGICDIKAVVLHYKTKFYCVDPEGKHVKKWLKKKQSGRNNREDQTQMHLNIWNYLN
ncbi:C-C motif chemokine 28-like [Protopterus annectens]|uniref:C-C motif chemokine 28-like n=1 Tax=Protopterus annectens TaxID=7888 RepID=UPI001CFC422C|nr:C-C motif chemokine 28-like [Protopterus annectens]